MKTYVITLSKVFLKGHRREGQPTDFAEKFRKQKKHTLRGNYQLWQKRIEEVQRGEACLSIRQWSDKPYRSKQVELAVLTKEDGVGIQKLYICRSSNFGCEIYKVGHMSPMIVAKNDGLYLEDWKDWFKGHNFKEPLAIIHFTYFRY